MLPNQEKRRKLKRKGLKKKSELLFRTSSTSPSGCHIMNFKGIPTSAGPSNGDVIRYTPSSNCRESA